MNEEKLRELARAAGKEIDEAIREEMPSDPPYCELDIVERIFIKYWRSHLGPSPCGREGHLMCHMYPADTSDTPCDGQPAGSYCTLCEAECQAYERGVGG